MGRAVCWLPQCSTGCYGWLVLFLEAAKLHLLGELSFYQQERKTTLLARHLTFSQSGEQQEADECRGKKHVLIVMQEDWIVLVTGLELRSIQAVIVNVHTICKDPVLRWRTLSVLRWCGLATHVLTYSKLNTDNTSRICWFKKRKASILLFIWILVTILAAQMRNENQSSVCLQGELSTGIYEIHRMCTVDALGCFLFCLFAMGTSIKPLKRTI